MRLPAPFDRLWRRWFGTVAIDDARENADEAPYTFFLPSAAELSAIRPGDSVKVIVRSVPKSRKWGAERMWVQVAEASGDQLAGELTNQPWDIPQLRAGAGLAFPRTSVINIDWAENRPESPPPPPERREYWERCMVDDCVLYGRSPVDYLYREEPDLAGPDDEYPDSGWRIRGTDDGIAEDSALERTPNYVAIGAVLNHDDSWLHLLDSPEGSRFTRDPATGNFVPCENDDQ